MKQEIKFKKLKLWSKDEINLLKFLFNKIPLQRNKTKSKTEIIRDELLKHGYNRSKKSIRRKLYRLNLTDFKINNERKIKVNCCDCGEEIEVRERYYKLYNTNNFRCEKCRERKRRNWSMTEKGKLYYKYYIQNYYRKKNGN